MTSRSARIWSLAEMLKFKAKAYHQAMGSLNRALVLCMTVEGPVLAKNRKDKLSKEIKDAITELLNHVLTSVEELGLEISAMATNDTLKELASESELDVDQLERELGSIDVTVRRELSKTTLYAVSKDMAKYIGGEAPCFGAEVDLKFPGAASDIEEAGTCLALGRSTACVFHLMRVMEHGLRAISGSLALPDPTGGARNWKILLDEIQAEMTRRAQNANAGWKKKSDKALFQEMHGSLDAVRSAWRNATMHIERRYSEEEAEHAYLMVRAFMKKLADRCDENGEPKA